MRRIATYLLAGFALLSFCSVQNAHAADAVAVEPAYVTPGKPITLKWYFTGEKVLLSGGRFGKGVVVTGKTSITDTPRATTKYTFDVWYKVPAPKPVEPKTTDPKLADPKVTDTKAVDTKVADPKTTDPKATDPKVTDTKATDPKLVDPKAVSPTIKDPKATDPKATAPLGTDPKATDPKTADVKVGELKTPQTQAGDPKVADPKLVVPAPQEMILQHVQYTTYAEVWSGVYPPMKAVRDSHGWQLSCLNDWKRDSVPTAEEGSDGLTYLQVEDDSVERVAIAIMPCQEQTVDDVLKRVSDDVDSHYQHAALATPVDLTFNGVPAKMLTFTGLDISHPGTKTGSVVLLFVRKGRAYVLSARTGATHFNSRLPVLEKVLRSFTFTK